jgi:hypothetical protein
MTVCIAARSEAMLLMVADRMITSGDIEFEPPIAKITLLTSSIAIMFSGDSALYAEVAQELLIDVRARIAAEPTNWLKVKDVVDLYCKHWARARYRLAEIEVLAPYGLTRETFLSQIVTLDPRIAEKISDGMTSQRLPGLEVIIAGVDQRFGADDPRVSIYHVADGFAMCQDQISFVAIGTGARHVESQLMRSHYTGNTENPEACLLLYSAKRDAKIAPGVGNETDIFAIGPMVGQNLLLPDDLKSALEAQYQKIKVKDKKARQMGISEIDRALRAAANQATQAQEPSATAGTAISAVSTGIGPAPSI